MTAFTLWTHRAAVAMVSAELTADTVRLVLAVRRKRRLGRR